MRNELAAVLLVVAIFAGASVGYLASNQLTSPRTSTEAIWLTTTDTALQSSASNSSWRFVVSINTTTVGGGASLGRVNLPLGGGLSLLLWANLTNTSPSNRTIRPYVAPFINPSITAANGTEVWAWNPPQVTWPNMNVTGGQTLSQRVDISAANFRDGVYTIDVAPLSSEFSENFNLTLRFSVQIVMQFG